MNVEIINKPFCLNIYGFGGTALGKDYAGKAFQLMDKMWQVVKGNGLKHKGMNIWVYEPNEYVFAGVELIDIPDRELGLESKIIDLEKYAYYKHIGPYQFIKKAGENMSDEIRKQGLATRLPYVEIYGHWTSDENKLETELLMCLQ